MDGFTVSNSVKFLEGGRIEGATGRNPVESGGLNSSDKSFSDTLKDAINSVNQLQVQSDKSIQNLASGKTDNIAEVMVAAEKADIALKVMVQVRNKMIDAYQDIMKMQV